MSTIYELEVLPKKDSKQYYWYNGKRYFKTKTTISKKKKAEHKKWFKSLSKERRATVRAL